MTTNDVVEDTKRRLEEHGFYVELSSRPVVEISSDKCAALHTMHPDILLGEAERARANQPIQYEFLVIYLLDHVSKTRPNCVRASINYIDHDPNLCMSCGGFGRISADTSNVRSFSCGRCSGTGLANTSKDII